LAFRSRGRFLKSYADDITTKNRLRGAIFSFRLPLSATQDEYKRERPSIAKARWEQRKLKSDQ
jgi:hypothetical protein